MERYNAVNIDRAFNVETYMRALETETNHLCTHACRVCASALPNRHDFRQVSDAKYRPISTETNY